MKVNVNQPWDLSRLSAAAPSAADAGGEAAMNKRADAVASQFEQLLLRQMLSQLRASSFNAEEDAQKPSAGYLKMADDQLAATIASVGGLGLGNTVRRWMKGAQAYQTAAQPPG